MYGDTILLLPLGLITTATVLAAVLGFPAVNRRVTIAQAGWLLALFPLAAFIVLLSFVPELNDGVVLSWQIIWLPSLGLSLGFMLDAFSALFALLVTFIGILVMVYSGQYFNGDQKAWRFLTYMLLFMVSMLGLVMAGDVITLFIFWEGTSIVSYLLVAYKTYDKEARVGAFRALLITGGGGIALLLGLLLVSSVTGSTQFADILQQGDVLRSSFLYPAMLGLVALGAFTKSAQWPFHIWLPGAMSAPTPASAYLHSATMVKAGIYLMARMNPALGHTLSWFWLLTLVGLVTMLAGAYLGLKQNDLKGLLAYSTISVLGMLMMLIGRDVSEAYKALVIGILAHGLYKSALFLVAGNVDRETGTRDMRHLGGLRKTMPFTFVVGTVAALSMAGLPPLFGFLAKETLLAATISAGLPPLIGRLLPLASVLAGALLLAQALLLIRETFLGQPKDPAIKSHEAPWPMWLMPAIPAALSLLIGLLPEPEGEAVFLARAASAAFGDKVKVSLALWSGVNIPLLLSGVAITLGLIIFVFRRPIRTWQQGFLPGLSFNAVYEWLLAAVDRAGWLVTRLQTGNLRFYLSVILGGAFLIVILLANRTLIPDPGLVSTVIPNGDLQTPLLRLVALLSVVGSALATLVLRRDFSAVLAMSAAGLAMALLFMLEPAPDVALVQIVVDLLATVILVLALSRIPRIQRAAAQRIADAELHGRNKPTLLRDLSIAIVGGAIVASLAFTSLATRPHVSIVTPYYEAHAKEATGADDVVGAIVVDFREMDTVIEIAVFSAAGLGVAMLLHYAARKAGDKPPPDLPISNPGPDLSTLGVAGPPMSPFIRVAAEVVMPFSIILATVQIMYGHEQPGDGFTAGVIVGLAAGLWYIVFGLEETRRRLLWLRGIPLISAGVLLALITGLVTGLMEGSILANVDFGEMIGLQLPAGFHLSSSLLFELAISLTVLGSVALMLNGLGRPAQKIEQINTGGQPEAAKE